jgi:hypothetical protein
MRASWPGRIRPALLFPEAAMNDGCAMAGLLTCSFACRLPVPHYADSGQRQANGLELTAAGTVPELHGIPSSLTHLYETRENHCGSECRTPASNEARAGEQPRTKSSP